MTDRCVVCGDIIPEGVQVCPKCYWDVQKSSFRGGKNYVEVIRTQAIKEFAKRLKEKAFIHERPFEANEDKFIKLVAVDDIDNLVKEMVGEKDV